MGKKKSLKPGFKKASGKTQKTKTAVPAPLQLTSSSPSTKKLSYIWLPPSSL